MKTQDLDLIISGSGAKRPETLLDLIELPAHASPSKTAIALVEQTGETENLNYGELWASSRNVASWLSEQGVEKGDRVLLIYPTGREFLLSFFGVILAGGIPVPFTPPFGLAKIETYLPNFKAVSKDCGAKLCLTNSRLALVLRGSSQGSGEMNVLAMSPSEVSPAECFTVARPTKTDVAFLQYTSGSTSQPKGVMLTHANLIANIDAFTGALNVVPGDVAVSWLPLFHDMGLIGMLLGSLYSQVPLYLMSPESFIRSPELWLKTISRYGGTLTAAPNFAFHYCVKRIEKERVADLNLSSIRSMLNGAEPVDVAAVQGFYDHFASAGLKANVILPVYGLAESSLAVTFPKNGVLMTETVDADALESDGVVKTARPGARAKTLVSVGGPIRTQQIQVVDNEGAVLGEKRIGEILVQGPSVMQGYYQKLLATAEAFTENWLHTGDYGFLSGGNLYITGRKKDLIIRRGRNYFPQDIEAVVSTVSGVRKGRAVAFGVEKGGSETEVVIVSETRVTDPTERERISLEVMRAIARNFPFSPIDVKLVPAGTVPRTSSGKIRRQPCKDLYLRGELLKKQEGGVASSAKLIVSAVTGNARHLARRFTRVLAFNS